MIRAVVVDIEGTTTRLSFVKEVLFPDARARLPDWVRAHPDAPEIEATRTLAGTPEASLDQVTATLLAWMDEDRKATPLKSIQGLIWAEGFESGRLVGHVYPDVPAALAHWHRRGVVLGVYSSGSVLAQQQLFGHTEFGNLRPLFSAWFDTTTGPKTAPDSYTRIAAALGFTPDEVLFLSDVTAEVEAARAAGMRATLVEREGGAVPDFSAVHLEDPIATVVNLNDKLAQFHEHWSPKIVGQVNGQLVKLAKLHGEFVWHAHADADEMFFVVAGTLRIRLEDRELVLRPGDFTVIPKGVRHLPIADEEVHVMLLEPESTVSAGEVMDPRSSKGEWL